eukprot:scaffold28090_cov18-Tisochrysis_lutea.AAC.1
MRCFLEGTCHAARSKCMRCSIEGTHLLLLARINIRWLLEKTSQATCSSCMRRPLEWTSFAAC